VPKINLKRGYHRAGIVIGDLLLSEGVRAKAMRGGTRPIAVRRAL
jgi:hypothetical protein